MTDLKKILYLLGAFAAILFLPYAGGWLRYDGVFPPHFFDFPELVAPPKAGFSQPIFIGVAVVCVALAVFYIFPQWFGFKKPQSTPDRPRRASLPVWFWIGLGLWAPTLLVMWSHLDYPKWLLNWACIPLFWGFTLLLDGIVYVRTGGRSMLATSPRELLGIGVASSTGWMIFEYLNFFVDDNWIYPKGNLIPDDEFVMYAVIGSAGLMPMAIEWYDLFNSTNWLRRKYENGPRLTFPKWLKTGVLLVLLVGLFAISAFPNDLFGLLWVAPLFILSIALSAVGVATPFTPLKHGNWAPLLLSALTYLVQGFLCECWNYYSGIHTGGELYSFNPDYWTYSIPFVDVYHVFEMPILGFAGYLPFGVYCLVWWIYFAWLLGIPSRFVHAEEAI
jgi:hypothetical protein